MKKTKILIIDDEKELLENLVLPLGQVVDDVVTADDGLEGLEKFKSQGPFDCVVCDIEMPNMKGVEVLKKIRELDQSVPFVFFTAFGSRERMLEVVKYGAHDFIEKPNIVELISSVKTLVYKMDLEESDDEQALSEYRAMLKGK